MVRYIVREQKSLYIASSLHDPGREKHTTGGAFVRYAYSLGDPNNGDVSTLTGCREDSMRCLKRYQWVCCRLARDVRATAWGRHENAVLVCDLQSGVLLYHITR